MIQPRSPKLGTIARTEGVPRPAAAAAAAAAPRWRLVKVGSVACVRGVCERSPQKSLGADARFFADTAFWHSRNALKASLHATAVTVRS